MRAQSSSERRIWWILAYGLVDVWLKIDSKQVKKRWFWRLRLLGSFYWGFGYLGRSKFGGKRWKTNQESYVFWSYWRLYEGRVLGVLKIFWDIYLFFCSGYLNWWRESGRLPEAFVGLNLGKDFCGTSEKWWFCSFYVELGSSVFLLLFCFREFLNLSLFVLSWMFGYCAYDDERRTTVWKSCIFVSWVYGFLSSDSGFLFVVQAIGLLGLEFLLPFMIGLVILIMMVDGEL